MHSNTFKYNIYVIFKCKVTTSFVHTVHPCNKHIVCPHSCVDVLASGTIMLVYFEAIRALITVLYKRYKQECLHYTVLIVL